MKTDKIISLIICAMWLGVLCFFVFSCKSKVVVKSKYKPLDADLQELLEQKVEIPSKVILMHQALNDAGVEY